MSFEDIVVQKASSESLGNYMSNILQAQAGFLWLTMKRGFLLSDGKKLSVDVKDKDFAKTVEVSTQVLDPDLGVSMVKVTAAESMDVKVKIDKDGNVTFDTMPHEEK